MSKATLTLTIVLVLAVAGMAAWMMNLEARQDEIAPSGDSGGPGSRPDDGDMDRDRLGDLEKAMSRLEQEVGTHRSRINEIEGNVGDLRLVQEGFAERVASASPRAVAPSEAMVTAPEGELKAAIESVLAAKAEEERKQRAEGRARMTAGWMLSGIDVTADQREGVVKVMTTYMEERDRVRKEYSGDNVDAQARTAAYEVIDQTRNDEMIRIIGSNYFQKIEERMNRIRSGRGGFGGRTGGRGRGGGR